MESLASPHLSDLLKLWFEEPIAGRTFFYDGVSEVIRCVECLHYTAVVDDGDGAIFLRPADSMGRYPRVDPADPEFFVILGSHHIKHDCSL